MPRIRQNAEKYAAEDFRKEIRRKQGEYDLMSISALAEEADMPRRTLSKRMEEPLEMTFEEFRKINSTIHPDPLTVLALLGYEQKEINRMLRTGQGSASA